LYNLHGSFVTFMIPFASESQIKTTPTTPVLFPSNLFLTLFNLTTVDFFVVKSVKTFIFYARLQVTLWKTVLIHWGMQLKKLRWGELLAISNVDWFTVYFWRLGKNPSPQDDPSDEKILLSFRKRCNSLAVLLHWSFRAFR